MACWSGGASPGNISYVNRVWGAVTLVALAAFKHANVAQEVVEHPSGHVRDIRMSGAKVHPQAPYPNMRMWRQR